MYYACLEFIPEKRGQYGYAKVVKKSFETREEAREYIRVNFNPVIHSKCWTE